LRVTGTSNDSCAIDPSPPGSEDKGKTTERVWFGHPAGLTILFLTETSEKFSFYGMRALLVYYMTKELMIPQARASNIYGYYGGFVYLTPILGAVIADRWLGRSKAVVLGGSIMAIGHFMMAFEFLFFPALAILGTGNGLFLPSLPSQVSGLYRPGDPRLGAAYRVYYVGVNLGAFLAPLVCGWLGETYGWHYGFAAAGVGMVLGVLVYLRGMRFLPSEPLKLIVQSPLESRAARKKMVTLFGTFLAIAAAVAVFRGAFEQTGNTLALWADVGIDRNLVGGAQIPMTWFQSVNPLSIFVLTPAFIARWTWRAKDEGIASSLLEMSLGATIVGLSFFMIAGVAFWSESHANVRASWLWLALFFVVVTVGELYILPAGLSLFGRMAPPGFAATTLATWFSASAAGNLLAGQLGALWSRLSHSEFFGVMGAVAMLAAALLLLHVSSARQRQR
jgi:POT family proton-dependent oligopeptide transporter